MSSVQYRKQRDPGHVAQAWHFYWDAVQWGGGPGQGADGGGHVCNAKAQQGEGEKSEHQGDEGRFLRR